MSAATQYRSILKHLQFIKELNQSQTSLQFIKEQFKTQQKPQLAAKYNSYLKEMKQYTDLLSMYRIGHHDSSVENILKSSAKTVGLSLTK